jgi:hypothetical protein
MSLPRLEARRGLLCALGVGASALLLGALTAVGVAAPAEAPAASLEPQDLTPTTALGALGANWAVSSGEPLLSFLEPTAPGRHRLRVLARTASGWQERGTISDSDRFFVNWADFPALVETSSGSLWAHWLERTGESTYAYGIALARSIDGGRTWQRLGWLNDDGSKPVEHGFVSWLRDGDDARAFWLDGRATDQPGGAMSVRTAKVGTAPAASELVDPRVCDCCQTAAAMTSQGPVVVYRDRSADEVRDLSIVRRTAAGWSEPRPVAADRWKIAACPVNGPAVVADGNHVTVAWYTGAGDGTHVRVASSSDGGASFGPALEIEGGQALGRVALAGSGPGEVVLAWMTVVEDGSAELRLLRLGTVGASRTLHAQPLGLARTSAGRVSGFPRLRVHDGRLLVAWTEVGKDRGQARLRVTSLPVSSIPKT